MTKNSLRTSKWLKALRNNIEHHQFDMDVPKARQAMGRLVQAISEFHEEVDQELDIAEFVQRDNDKLFQELANTYTRELKEARVSALEKSEDGAAQACVFCTHEGTAAFIAGELVCQYCNEVDSKIECCICGQTVRWSRSVDWNEEYGDRACEDCEDRIRNMD